MLYGTSTEIMNEAEESITSGPHDPRIIARCVLAQLPKHRFKRELSAYTFCSIK